MGALPDSLIGELLGKDYRVIEPIGVGGMALVYLVEHQTLLKRFAAKVLSPELAANLEARARFTQEAHAASQLDHENIVTISDFGVTSDQRPFFVMELLRGQTLGQRLDAGPMSLEEIVSVAVPLGRALSYAHDEGIVHRDVKPENIFLVQRSQNRWSVKVVDFGIAKTPMNPKLTKMGQTLGSPMYMAPEACRGEDVDHRADVYSFGIILYEMMCGHPPFQDESLLKVLQAQIGEPLPRPCDVNPALDPALGAVLERALEKSPLARYQSIDDVLEDLQAALPPGADRLLIEAQYGTTKAFRATPFPSASQPIPILSNPSSQDLPAVMMPAPVVQPAVAAAPPSRRGLVIGLAGAIALVGIAIAFFGTRGSTSTAKPPAVVEPPTVVTLPTQPTEAPKPPAARTVGRDHAPATATHSLRIESTPAGATVEIDGQEKGKTPTSIEVPINGGSVSLVVRAEGYAEIARLVDASIGDSLKVELQSLEPATATTVASDDDRDRDPEPSGARAKKKRSPPREEPTASKGSGDKPREVRKPPADLGIRTSR